MTRLTFTLCASSVRSLRVLDWEQLQTCLQKLEFSYLQCVRFIMVPDQKSWELEYPAQARSFVRSKMDECDRRGILQFDFMNSTNNFEDDDE